MGDIRVRFAPSPTGYLHIGGVRTALYSWLWARRRGGTFVLRVEDTDQARDTPEANQAIFESMQWLGLDWDEGPEVGGPYGPYRQSQRLEIYAEHAQRLLDAGKAYRCYATKEDKERARAAFVAAGGKAEGFAFESPWRDRQDGDPSQPHVVRFKTPRGDGVTGWDDLVRGHLQFAHASMQDFVLIRGDGMPLYNFACVVDDKEMRISHVVRGEDHIINTAPQILLFEAFGVEVPLFAHCPMILGENGQKLSKRHAAVSVSDYREQGFLPDAVLNYLVRLGWSHGDQEIFTREDLIEKFDFDHVGRTGAKYDIKKFMFVQEEHLRALPPARIAELALPFMRAQGLTVAADDPRLEGAFLTVRPRSNTLADAAARVAFYFQDAPEMDPKAVKKFLKPEAAELLAAFATAISEVEPFDETSLEAAVNAWMQSSGAAMKQFAQAVRVSLTGSSAAPGLYEIMTVLGRDVTLARLAAGQELAARGA